MNTNLVADTLYSYLINIHERVYRNAPPKVVTFPYVVFNCESASDTYPSTDYYIYIDIFDDPNGSVRTMEALADSIDAGLNHKVIDNANINIHMLRSVRQFVSNTELTTAKLINLQYQGITYFK
jgi:hypothetical protein